MSLPKICFLLAAGLGITAGVLEYYRDTRAEVLTVENPDQDLGGIPSGIHAPVVYRIRNDGSETLYATGVNHQCDRNCCYGWAHGSGLELKPHSTTELTIELLPRKPGEFRMDNIILLVDRSGFRQIPITAVGTGTGTLEK
jgi:hypothetical protein